jgi:hypothetical protein
MSPISHYSTGIVNTFLIVYWLLYSTMVCPTGRYLLWRRRKGTSSALISLTIKKLFSLAKKEIVVDQEISLVNEIR